MRGIALTILLIGMGASPASAGMQEVDLDEINRRLAGQVVDYTHNHGRDNRLWSAMLCQKRDVYVYLPPCYDPAGCYPLVVWCHGAFGDEHAFLDTAQLEYLDCLIRRGCMPGVIVVCADGTCNGENKLLARHSFYINGCCGRFEDHLMDEVIPFVMHCYSVCPDRRRHAIIGVSAGGFGGLGLALKRRDFFSTAATLAGAINLRYQTAHGDTLADFNPATYRWRTDYDPREVIGKFAGGLVRIKARLYIEPVFGTGQGVVARVARENPADLLFTTDLQPGELNLLIAYGGRDNLNFDAHAESFVYLARACRGIDVAVARYPDADHGLDFFRASQRHAWRWLCSIWGPGDASADEDYHAPLPDTAPFEADLPIVPPSP